MRAFSSLLTVAMSVRAEEVLALEQDFAALDDRRLRQDAENRPHQRGLTAAGFADHAEDAPARQRELDTIQDLRHAFIRPDRKAQVPDLENGRAHRERLRRGSTMSRRPSPSRLKPSTVRKIARPGKVENHQASGRYWRLSEIASPQSGSGGVAPMPRKPSTAATRIVKPMPMVARTMTGEMQFGRMWRKRMRAPLAPMHCSASMKSAALSRRVSA